MSAMTFRMCAFGACTAVLLTASRSEQPKPKDAEALIVAAERFDVPALRSIVGPDGKDLVITKDVVQDENQASAFAAQARVKTSVVRDPETPKVATLTVGAEDGPMPIPLVEENGAWRLDSMAGREEVLFRRVGRNELDAIEICGYYFKILKGQGPDAPMGEMDFVVGGVMIGGFALVAAPAEYAVTGVNSFIVRARGSSTRRTSGRVRSTNSA